MNSIKRLAPGYYEMTDGTNTVTIRTMEHMPTSGPRWMAEAGWDSYLYTDPLWTYADAKVAAALMLKEGAA